MDDIQLHPLNICSFNVTSHFYCHIYYFDFEFATTVYLKTIEIPKKDGIDCLKLFRRS